MLLAIVPFTVFSLMYVSVEGFQLEVPTKKHQGLQSEIYNHSYYYMKNCHFVNYRLSFRKLQIFHFANYRFL